MLAIAGCGGPAPTNEDGGPDGATGDGGTDRCEGRPLCTSAGTSCDGDELVACAEDADECLVETRTDCGASSQVCDDSGATPACVDPCSLTPEEDRCDTDGERACQGELLEICAADSNGCLVLARTDCAEAPGGVCEESGELPVCAAPADPCDSIPSAERCDTEGTSCEGETLVTCAPNAFGCLVRMPTDCSARAGGTCEDASSPAACAFSADPCDGVVQCAAASVRCDGPELVTCALDGYGCLVEARVACAAAPFGFCDADALPSPICSTAAVDPCLGLDACGTSVSRTCADAETLSICAPNAFGCYVSTATSCADAGEVCSEAGGTAICGDPCSIVTICPSSTYCDGSDVVTCAADTNGCLVEDTRSTCDGACEDAACVGTCAGAAPTVLSCSSGTVSGDTTAGTARISSYECTSYSYPGNEQLWVFRNDGLPAVVEITATRGASSADFDLYVLDAGDGSAACDSGLACLDYSTAGIDTPTETVTFTAGAGELAYLAYDVYGSTPGTTDYTLEVTCTPIVCGDGIVNGDERCDDAATEAGDGCSATCTVEDGYACFGVGAGSCFAAAANATCAGAIALDASGVSGADLRTGGPRPTGASCGASPGPVLYYSVDVPAGTAVTVTGTPTGAAWDLTLRSAADCGGACLAHVDAASSGALESVTFSNTSASPITRLVAVGAYSRSTLGTFDLAVSSRTLPPHASCSGARSVTGSTSFAGEATADGGTSPTGTGCGSAGGPSLYYAVTVPATTRATVTVTSGSGFDAVVRVLDACSATSCLSRTDLTGSAGTETVTLENLTSSPITRVVVVNGYSLGSTGTYGIDFAYETVTVAPNATCDGATAVGGATTIASETTTLGGVPPSGSACGADGGASLYYAVSVPASTRAVVTVAGAAGFNAVVKVLDACSATDCSSRTDATSGGGTEMVLLDNDTSSAITRIVVVNASVAGSTGTFDLSVAYVTPAANATCGGATAITGATTLSAVNTVLGGSAPTGTGCGTTGGPSLYYSITVPAGTRTTLTVSGATGFDAVVKELDSCAATACPSRTDATSGGGTETVRFENLSSSPVTRLVAVNGYSAGSLGTFDLSVVHAALAPNSTCGGATAITGSMTITGEELADGGPRPAGSGCGLGAGTNTLYYSVTIGPGESVLVETTPAINIVLFTQNACSESDCTSYTDTSPERTTLANYGTTPMTRIVGVRPNTLSSGTFDIGFVYTTMTLAPNATCASATAITGSSTFTGEQLSGGGPRPAGSGCGGGAGTNTLYYAVTMGPGERVLVQTTPDIDVILFTQDACSDSGCTFSTDSAPESTTLANYGASPITRIVGVRPYYAVTTGSFDIAFAYTTMTLAPNATCASATSITGSSTFTGEQLSGGGPRPAGTGCGGGSGTNTLYYAVTMGPGERVLVQTTPTIDIILFTQNACSDSGCTLSTDSSPESTTLANYGASPITRIVGVRPYSASSGSFDIAFAYTTMTLAPNATCASATAITDSISITGEALAEGGPRPAGTGCGFGAGTNTLYYAVTLDPGESVLVQTTPAIDIVLFTQDACTASDCTFSTDSTPERATLANVGSSPITRIVGVRPYSASSGSYDIAFTYSLLPYGYAPITAACVTGGTWASLTRSSPTSDDATTAVTALPFPMTYFGEAVSHFSTNTNGIAQLWSSSTGTPSTAYSNASMPNSSTPNGVVAPFWDDLYLGTGFDIRTQTVGSAGSQTFVIEWNAALAGSGGAPITFQAHFFETTNVIEYHYCSIGAGTGGTGSGATIGIENLAGTVGLTISHNTAAAVSTGSGFRITPL